MPSASIAVSTPPRSLSSARVPVVGRLLASSARAAGLGLLALHPALVGDEPEEREVGVGLAVEDRLEVELDVGLPGERRVVAQDAQGQAVRDEAPETFRGAVEKLLDEPVRRLAGSTGDTLRPPIKGDPTADEMDRDGVPGVGDRIGLAFDIDRGGALEAAIPKLVEERQQPALSSDCRPWVPARQGRALRLEGGPGTDEPVPAPGDRLAEPQPVVEVVGGERQPGNLRVVRCDPSQEVGGQEAALGSDRRAKTAAASQLHRQRRGRREGRHRRRGRRRGVAVRLSFAQPAGRPCGRGRVHRGARPRALLRTPRHGVEVLEAGDEAFEFTNAMLLHHLG